MRILIVDDEPILHEIFAHALNPDGHELEFATNGDDAFRLYCERGPYDAVLTDVAHPGMFGFDLVRAIQQRNPRQVCGFVTGNPVLQKPFTLQELVKFVDSLKPH